jgi:hypothetical protein
MPLSDDQRAMLRLLAQREQGYGDIAALMGLSVAEVRDKVKDALAQLEEEGKSVPLPAEPPAPSRSEPAEEPAASAVAPPPAVEDPAGPVAPPPQAEDQPVTPAAAAEPPASVAPQAAASAASATGKAAARPAARPRISLPSGNGARAAIAAGAVVLVALVVVLAVSGGDSGSSGAGTTAAAETSGNGEETAGATPVNSKEVTKATLSAVDGSDASGVAVFGRVKNSLALQIEATGLAPSGNGRSYTIWLYESPQKMLPLATTAVGKSGKIGAQVEVPTEVLAYLANETFDQINVSLTEDKALKASLDKATQEKKAPAYTGTDVLRGRITGPIIGAAKKAKK